MIQKDAIIIGSGQAAKPLSQKLSHAGWKVLMIEKSEKNLGGTCLNTGCTPTKTLIASAEVMHEIRTAKKHGISVSDLRIDFNETQHRKEAVINNFKDALKQRTEDAPNLELLYGKATFKSEKVISVETDNGTEEYTAEYIFIDAGSRPRIPDIDGLDEIKWYDSKGILELREIPRKLVIAGAGYIGLELGQMFHRFGSEIILLDSGDRFLPKEDRDTAESLMQIITHEGIKIEINVDIKKVRKSGDDIEISYSKSGSTHEISATHFLLATGRESNADELQVSNAGIKTDDKGYIIVNDKLETNVEKVYALGDINGGPKFTHIAYNDFVIVSENILNGAELSTKDRIVPYCMYTDPQLGRTGMTAEQAKEKGLDFSTVTLAGSTITRAKETGKTDGLWKAIIDNETDKILGAAIISAEGGEIASMIQLAMEGGLTAKHLSTFIFSHPAYAESLNNLFSAKRE